MFRQHPAGGVDDSHVHLLGNIRADEKLVRGFIPQVWQQQCVRGHLVMQSPLASIPL